MENILPNPLPEIIFSSSDARVSKQISKLEQDGILKKLAARIYTPNTKDSPATIIGRNLFLILGKLYPGAMLSHRTALEFKPTSAGHVFITYTYTKKVSLPGIVLRFMEGQGPMDGDNPFSGELHVSQEARALLENLQETRQRGPESKTVTLPVLEDRLEQVIRTHGEAGLNALRDKTRAIAQVLGMQSEWEKLNKLIGAMLATKPSKVLTSPLAIARAFGSPYDADRLSLFQKLFAALQEQAFPLRPDPNQSPRSYRNFSFFEAYFSNYIEGTEFELSDAREIIETQTPMPTRDEDSHDILGTYQLMSNQAEMSVKPASATELLAILQRRHQVLLSARTSKNPGIFKHKNNRAGETYFVDHTLVRGTLTHGFDYYKALSDPFARAAFMMFLISEVHPFLDGNGRIARVMMNAELVAQGQTRIIIPTVFRDDYMMALRKLTRQKEAGPYIRMLQRAQAFSATILGDNMDEMELQLVNANAFKSHEEAWLVVPGN